jgi:hypothetical protein
MSLFTSVYKNPPNPEMYLKTKQQNALTMKHLFLASSEYTRISAKYSQQTQYPTLNYT